MTPAIRRTARGIEAYRPVGDPVSPGGIGLNHPEYGKAFRNWLHASVEGIQADHFSRHVLYDVLEKRDIGVATGAAGGFLVPQAFADEVVIALKYASPVRELARTWVSDSGADAPLPQSDDVAQVGAIQAENVAVTALDVAFTSKTLKSWQYQSQLVKASWQLANDSKFPLESWLANLMGARIGRIQNTHFTTGTGTGQPEGFVTAGTVGTTLATGATTTLGTATTAYNSLVAFTATVDPAYRRDPSCAWMMNDATFTAVRQLSDTSTRPFLVDATAAGGTPTLLGWPVYINPDMATMAANAKTIAFGAWHKHYVVRDVHGFMLHELKERFSDQLQKGYFGTLRGDGRIADPKAVRLLQQSAS